MIKLRNYPVLKLHAAWSTNGACVCVCVLEENTEKNSWIAANCHGCTDKQKRAYRNTTVSINKKSKDNSSAHTLWLTSDLCLVKSGSECKKPKHKTKKRAYRKCRFYRACRLIVHCTHWLFENLHRATVFLTQRPSAMTDGVICS